MPTIFRDKVICNGITFNDALAKPAGAGEWGLDVLVGWSATPDIEAEFAPKGIVDGEVPPDDFPIRGRQLTVGGYCTGTDRATLEALWDTIVRDAFPRGKELTFARYEGVPKFLKAYVSGPREPEWYGNPYAGPYGFRWGVQLRAPDPMKYALAPQVQSAGVAGFATGGRTYPRVYPLVYSVVLGGEGNSAVFTNSGTGDSKNLTVDITGPLNKGSWRIVNETTNELLKFDVAVAAGEHLVIDFLSETATLNDSAVSATIAGDFWSLATGVNVIKLYSDFDPTAGFTATAYSAWE